MGVYTLLCRRKVWKTWPSGAFQVVGAWANTSCTSSNCMGTDSDKPYWFFLATTSDAAVTSQCSSFMHVIIAAVYWYCKNDDCRMAHHWCCTHCWCWTQRNESATAATRQVVHFGFIGHCQRQVSKSLKRSGRSSGVKQCVSHRQLVSMHETHRVEHSPLNCIRPLAVCAIVSACDISSYSIQVTAGPQNTCQHL